MIHLLLIGALVLFVLWVIGLAGAWAASTAWTLFVIACALVVVWAIFSMVGGGRRTVP
jgi:hypothetical protein